MDLTRFSYWIDTLVLKLKEILTAPVLHHPFLFKGKPTQAQEVSRRISGAVAGEYQVKNSLPSTCQFLAPGTILSEAYPSNCRKLISCIYLFHLSFSSPPLLKNKNLQKYLPFSFALFFCLLSVCLCGIAYMSL